MLFAPLYSSANLFSGVFGNSASADTGTPVEVSQSNSQNISILEANVSIATKKDKTEDKEIDIVPAGTTSVSHIVSDSALLPMTGPQGALEGTGGPDEFSADQVSVYVVRKGDTVSKIAEMFEVSAGTIYAANDMKKGDSISEGQILLILPITAIEIEVKKGQTLGSIAKSYGVDIADIAGYNGISTDAKLAVGDTLIIPGAEMLNEGSSKSSPASDLSDKKYNDNHPVKNISGYFINPVPGARKTQGLHIKGRAVDLAIAKGTPIKASASGKVLVARQGYNGGYGTMVILQHPNGTKTLYAHMSKLGTNTGANVKQGEVIGYVGNTGKSTGAHLHFEVHGAPNPGATNSWAR